MKKILIFILLLMCVNILFSQEKKYKLRKVITTSYVKDYYDEDTVYNFKVKKEKKPLKFFYKKENESISLNLSTNFNLNFERRYKHNSGGFGIDIYHDKVIYPDYFWNKYYSQNSFEQKLEAKKYLSENNFRVGIGIYKISSSLLGFDISYGIGIISYNLKNRNLEPYWGKFPNNILSLYYIIGFTKEVRISENIHIQLKGIFRNTRKFGQNFLFEEENLGRITKFEPLLGIRYDFN